MVEWTKDENSKARDSILIIKELFKKKQFNVLANNGGFYAQEKCDLLLLPSN